MPRNPWTYRKRKRSKKFKKNTDSEESGLLNMEETEENQFEKDIISNTENQFEEANISNTENKIKNEVKSSGSPTQLPRKHHSTALMPGFGILEAQKPVDDLPVKVKKEPLDVIPAQVPSDSDDIEIVDALKPVKRFKPISEETTDTNEDITMICEMKFELEREEAFLGVLKDTSNNDSEMEVTDVNPFSIEDNVKKELCDTAPSSPVSENGELSNQLTPEELELSKLALVEANSPLVTSVKSCNDDTISKETFSSSERLFVGCNVLKHLDFGSKTRFVNLHSCSQVLTIIQKELENFKSDLPITNENSFEESIRKSVLKYHLISNTATIPPPVFAPITEKLPQPNIMQHTQPKIMQHLQPIIPLNSLEPNVNTHQKEHLTPKPRVNVASNHFPNRELSIDTFKKELDIEQSKLSLQTTKLKSPSPTQLKLDPNVDSLLNSLKKVIPLVRSATNSPNMNEINQIINVQSKASNAYYQENASLISEQHQPSSRLTITSPKFVPIANNVLLVPETLQKPPITTTNLPSLPNIKRSNSLEASSSHCMQTSSYLQQPTPSPFIVSNANQIINMQSKASNAYCQENASLISEQHQPSSRLTITSPKFVPIANNVSLVPETLQKPPITTTNLPSLSNIKSSNNLEASSSHCMQTSSYLQQPTPSPFIVSNANQIINVQSQASNAYCHENASLISEQLQPSSRLTITSPKFVPIAKNVSLIPETLQKPPITTTNLPSLPNVKSSNSLEASSSHYMQTSSYLQQPTPSPFILSNANPSLPNKLVTVNNETVSLDDRKRNYPICDPRKKSHNQIPNKIPRIETEKMSQFTGESQHSIGNRQTRIETEKKRKINIKEYLNRRPVSDPRTSKSESADTSTGRQIEVARRFSPETDPRNSATTHHNLLSMNSPISSPSNISPLMTLSYNKNSIYGNPMPVSNGIRGLEHSSDPRNSFNNRSSPYLFVPSTPHVALAPNLPSINQTLTVPMPVRLQSNCPGLPVTVQSGLLNYVSYPASHPYENARVSLPLTRHPNEVVRTSIPTIPTPLVRYSINSPTMLNSNIHHQSPPLLTEQSIPNLTMQQPKPGNFASNAISQECNVKDDQFIKKRQYSCVSLVPRSVKEDIGKTFIPSSYAYLIMIEWSYDWLEEFENTGEPYIHPPPILPQTTSLSQVRNTYTDESDYYNTYFKLLLLESWSKLYASWKRLLKERSDPHQVFYGEIFSYEPKNEFNKYVIECFVQTSDVQALPRESCIVLLIFKGVKDIGNIRMFGYVSRLENRQVVPTRDQKHKAYVILNTPDMKDLYKYKVTIYTVFKSDDINNKELVSIQKLMNIRKILQQNDALINMSRSPLCHALLSPITSPNKFSASVPKGSEDYSNVMDQVCSRVLDPNPLLAMVHSDFTFSQRMAAISYLIKELHKTQQDAKVIICSKKEDTLSNIASNLKNHYPVYINRDRINDLQRYSLKKLVEKRNVDKISIEDGMEAKRNVQNHVIARSDVILLLLLGLEDEYTVMRLMQEFNIACFILDAANECTEPESIIPLTYGIRKYVLLGNKTKLCEVSDFTNTYDFNRSLFNRALL